MVLVLLEALFELAAPAAAEADPESDIFADKVGGGSVLGWRDKFDDL